MRPAINGGAPFGPWGPKSSSDSRWQPADFLLPMRCCVSHQVIVLGKKDRQREKAKKAKEDARLVLVAAASTALTLGCSAAAGASGVQMACIPMWAIPPPLIRAAAGAGAELDSPATRVRVLQQAFLCTCGMQASTAALEFILNDPLSGLIGCGISALGFQASQPTGFKFLPSYIVLAFCNGSMQVLLSMELAAARRALGVTASKSFWAKLAISTSLVSPVMMFAGLALAWHLHCELRNLALMPQEMRTAGQSDAAAAVAAAAAAVGPMASAASGPEAAAASFDQAGNTFRAFAGPAHRLVELSPKE